ncbi:MAG: 4-hydroxy-tetrahydrodipicolinate synthase [Anaerolineae bacterium]
MSQLRPAGMVCPIATPLTDDEGLDVAAYRRLLDRIVPHLDGVLVLGSTGEFALLEEAVAQRAVEVTVDHVAGRVPIYVGIGDTGTRRVLSKLPFLKEVGADYALVCSHFYYAVASDQALLDHYLTVADASPVPVLIYNITQNTHVNTPPHIMARLAKHPNVVGMKDSWGDMFQFQEFLRLQSDTFSVFQGREQLAASALWLGADGVVSALLNFAPEMLRRLAEQIAAGDHGSARETQLAINQLATLFDQGFWISALKVVLHRLGYGSERVAAPLPACSAVQKHNILRILAEAGIV